MDNLVDLLAGTKKRKLHLRPGAAAALARLTRRRVAPAALAILAADSLADGPDAAEEFGIELTPLREGLARSLPGMAGRLRQGAQRSSAPE
jgi:hypothetical protein